MPIAPLLLTLPDLCLICITLPRLAPTYLTSARRILVRLALPHLAYVTLTAFTSPHLVLICVALPYLVQLSVNLSASPHLALRTRHSLLRLNPPCPTLLMKRPHNQQWKPMKSDCEYTDKSPDLLFRKEFRRRM